MSQSATKRYELIYYKSPFENGNPFLGKIYVDWITHVHIENLVVFKDCHKIS